MGSIPSRKCKAVPKGCEKWEGYYAEGGRNKERAHYLIILKVTSILTTRKFQIVWIKIVFLGEVEATIKLGIKSWFGDMGINTSDSIWSLLSVFK